jgi:hypothetical protein
MKTETKQTNPRNSEDVTKKLPCGRFNCPQNVRKIFTVAYAEKIITDGECGTFDYWVICQRHI